MTPNEMLWKCLNSALIPAAERALDNLSVAQKDSAAQHPRTASLGSGKGGVRDNPIGAPEAREVGPDLVGTVRAAINRARAGNVAAPAVAAAVSSEPDDVFRTARKHAAWYFALNLAVAIATCLLFLGGAAGAIVTAVATGGNIWTAVLGGMSLAGAFGLFITKPIQMTYAALLATTRLDWLQLMFRQRLEDCASLPAPDQVIGCRTQVWQEIGKALASLDEPGAGSVATGSTNPQPAGADNDRSRTP